MHNEKVKWAKKVLEEFDKDGLSPDIQQLIKGWLAEDKNRAEKDDALHSVFDLMYQRESNPGREVYEALTKTHRILGFPETVKKKIPLRSKLLRVAAVLIPAAMIAGGVFFAWNERELSDTNKVANVTVEIPQGDSQIIHLPDGSEVQIGESTVFTYSKDFLNNRTVHLQGEAYFKVAKMDGKTFTVKSDQLAVTVLGTEFNVKSYSQDATAEVKLTTGSVSIQAEGIEENTILTPGQHYIYDKEHQTIELDEIGEDVLNRMRGLSLKLEYETTDEIFRSIGRFFDKRMVVEEGVEVSPNLVLDFSPGENIDEVMFVLQSVTGAFDYEVKQDTVTVTRRK